MKPNVDSHPTGKDSSSSRVPHQMNEWLRSGRLGSHSVTYRDFLPSHEPADNLVRAQMFGGLRTLTPHLRRNPVELYARA